MQLPAVESGGRVGGAHGGRLLGCGWSGNGCAVRRQGSAAVRGYGTSGLLRTRVVGPGPAHVPKGCPRPAERGRSSPGRGILSAPPHGRAGRAAAPLRRRGRRPPGAVRRPRQPLPAASRRPSAQLISIVCRPARPRRRPTDAPRLDPSSLRRETPRAPPSVPGPRSPCRDLRRHPPRPRKMTTPQLQPRDILLRRYVH